MFVSKALKINSKNHLEIGGCDCVDLVKEYGTPLYVMDENIIRENRLYKMPWTNIIWKWSGSLCKQGHAPWQCAGYTAGRWSRCGIRGNCILQ